MKQMADVSLYSIFGRDFLHAMLRDFVGRLFRQLQKPRGFIRLQFDGHACAPKHIRGEIF